MLFLNEIFTLQVVAREAEVTEMLGHSILYTKVMVVTKYLVLGIC